MPQARIDWFDDPDRFQASFRAGSYEFMGLPRGPFRAGLTHIDFPRLSMQRSYKSAPAAVHSTSHAARVGVMFLADSGQAPPVRNGVELSAERLVVHRPGSTNYLRSSGPSRLAMMSLTCEDLATAGEVILGRALTAPRNTHLIRPAPAALNRLRTLYKAACGLAESDPKVLARPSVARSLENDLIHAMVDCLAGDDSRLAARRSGRHAAVMAGFEDFLAARQSGPVYLAEICAAIGISERTLRTCCQEQLGMGPIHYLWRRRMNLARRALLHADPARATVTEIATGQGFWELGRFAVEYRGLFGETPSTSLHRLVPPRPELGGFAIASTFAESA